ncbi:MAG: hypothetical protein ACRCS9_07505 [Hyphomicrobium sp.]
MTMTSPKREPQDREPTNREPNVTSLDDARKRAALKAKSAQRADAGGFNARGADASGAPRRPTDYIVGGLIIAMALAFLVSLVVGMTGAIGGGAV